MRWWSWRSRWPRPWFISACCARRPSNGGPGMTVSRGIFLTGIFLLCAWTLVPLYFIALGAVGGREAVNSWPKAFSPTSVSFTTLREFLNIAGVWTSMLYSVEAAVLCMVFSILLGVPAGYALARFAFR